LGSVAGALLVARFGTSLPVYAAGMFGLGLLCTALRLDRAAYRFAGITVTVIMLIAHTEGVWLAALHRFIEVSIGIGIGVLVTALWPEDPARPVVSVIKAP
jgi:uncharacterized membrane protein YccC